MKLRVLVLLLLFIPEPTLAASKLNSLAIDSEPCKTVTLPNGGGEACVPRLTQSACLRAAIKQNGKFVRHVFACGQPRSQPKTVSAPTATPIKRGY